MKSKIDNFELEQICEQVRSAMAETSDDKARDALQISLRVLDSLVQPSPPDESTRYSGSIEYTFEDEQYEPFGREVDVRIHYSWYDYDSADEPSPVWGASIGDLEVLAVRHFDKDGNEVEPGEHCLDVAWHLLNENYEQVTEACTEDGYVTGAGRAPITYSPLRTSSTIAAPSQAGFASRMAPSVPTRAAQQDRRQLG